MTKCPFMMLYVNTPELDLKNNDYTQLRTPTLKSRNIQ